MKRHRGNGRRRGTPPVRLPALFGALAWVVSFLPGTVAAANPAAAVPPVAVLPAAPASALMCPGCEEFVLDLTDVDPTEDAFGTEVNSTVDVLVKFPPGWSSLACGDQYDVVARNEAVGGGVPVPGWRCSEPGFDTLRFSGPGAATVEDSAQRFLFRAFSPGPLNGLSAGFVDLVQTFRDGEQQRRRGFKQLQARRIDPPDDAETLVRVDLPPDWTARCLDADGNPVAEIATTARVGAGVAGIQEDGWTCTPIPGTGTNPRFRVEWTDGTISGRARFYYFEGVSAQDPPRLTPLSALADPDDADPGPMRLRLRDLMFADGQIRTALIAVLEPSTITPAPTPSPAVTITATPKPKASYQPLCPTPTPGSQAGSVPPPAGYPWGYQAAPGYQEGPFVYPYQPPRPPGQVPFPGYPFGVSPGIDGLAHDPCAPPTVIIDPCAGEVFTKNGSRRYLPEDRELPPGCAYPDHDYDHPQEIAYRGDRACVPTRPSVHATDGPPPRPTLSPAPPRPGATRSAAPVPSRRPTAQARPGALEGGYSHEPYKADRSYRRPPLRPAVEPTPPVVLVPPGDTGATAPVPGSAEARILFTSPNPSPAPTVRALLPESVDQLPYCDDLPRTGGDSMPLLRMALLTLGLGSALLAGAFYWRRNAPRGLRYTRP